MYAFLSSVDTSFAFLVQRLFSAQAFSYITKSKLMSDWGPTMLFLTFVLAFKKSWECKNWWNHVRTFVGCINRPHGLPVGLWAIVCPPLNNTILDNFENRVWVLGLVLENRVVVISLPTATIAEIITVLWLTNDSTRWPVNFFVNSFRTTVQNTEKYTLCTNLNHDHVWSHFCLVEICL